MASMPKMKRTSPASSQRSRCLVWVKSVSPRRSDLAEAGPRHRAIGLVQVDVGLLVRGAVAAAIDQVERLGGVGQRDQAGDDSPRCRCRRCPCPLALGVGRDEGAVGVEDGFLEELGRLLGPDPQPRLVDGVHQSHDVGSRKRRQKSPAVVGSGMRSAPRALR